MLGTLAEALPEGPDWRYEPKWDGFRVLVFREGSRLDLRSRDDRPLLRYFPELAEPLLAALPEVAVADGEIVISRDGALDFEALQLRLHPAASRVRRLSQEIPSAVVLWDLLARGDRDLREAPLRDRVRELEEAVVPGETVLRTPATTDVAVARDWYDRFQGAGFDGVMAKRLSEAYQPGKRALVKVKHVRTLDAAVLGFRWHKTGPGTEVGSLVLGLYDDEGRIHPIGVASSFTKKERLRLAGELGPLRDGADHPWARWEEHERRPDVHSRWNADRDLAWEPIREGLVVEITTTQHNRARLRHPAHVVRWRADREPRGCRLDQLAIGVPAELSALFA